RTSSPEWKRKAAPRSSIERQLQIHGVQPPVHRSRLLLAAFSVCDCAPVPPGANEARLGSVPLQSCATPVAECSQVDLGRHLPAIPAEVVDDVFVEEPRFPDG